MASMRRPDPNQADGWGSLLRIGLFVRDMEAAEDVYGANGRACHVARFRRCSGASVVPCHRVER